MEFLQLWFGTQDTSLLIAAILSVVFGLYMAWTIGANDVANAMATSVGSETLTFRQAIVIAGTMEFAGAVLVGGSVTNTIRKGIINVELFESDPTLLILGMLAALLAAALWLHGATLFGLPVSTTHSIVGAVVGFGLVVYGFSAVNWMKVFQIVLSWIVSPLCGGLVAYLLFNLIRKRIFGSEDSDKAFKFWGPLFTGLTFSIILLSIIYKGFKNLHLSVSPFISLGLAVVIFVLASQIHSFILKRSRKKLDDAKSIERVFMFLQAITAAYVAFAHGANDVANAIGPVAAVIATVNQGVVALQVPVPLWILVMGGLGIVLGLLTQGYKVMYTVGKNITKLTPSRGFSAEFSAATVVLVCSLLGLPISTTHTLVGAVLGIGIAQGVDSINLKVVKSIGGSWLLTLPVAGVLAIGIFFLLRALFI
ncbi:inorganic phosphate transporter [bacterium]|nr:inorganic phosphate transporter [bacterium]